MIIGVFIKMKNFKLLQEKRPDLAKMLEEMSKEEVLEHYASEVFEKEELEEYKKNRELSESSKETVINAKAVKR